MNKQCKNCGSNIPQESNFCHMCGGTEFFSGMTYSSRELNDDLHGDLPIYGQNVNTTQNASNQVNSSQSTMDKMPQKKKNKTTILLIVLIAMSLLSFIGRVAEKVIQKQNVPYTKGTFDGSVYANEWADIKLALPEGFSNATATEYAECEEANTECGACFVTEDGDMISIVFNKLLLSSDYDEKDALDEWTEFYNQKGFTHKTSDGYLSMTLAGNTYRKAVYEKDGVYVNCFSRKIDNFIMEIIVIGDSAEENDAVISNNMMSTN